MNAEINVTPLVDVCLVLLIIFMVAVPLMVSGTPVALPETKSGPPHAGEAIAITVKEDRTVYIDTLAVRRDQLESELARKHAASPHLPVAVRADKRVAYGDVAEVLGACREAGWEDVSLLTLRKQP